MSKEYVIAETNSIHLDNFWFERNIHSLEEAQQKAANYPKAKYIIEYQSDGTGKGMLPTGRAWAINDVSPPIKGSKGEGEND